MAGILFFWGFGSFLFFKVALDVSFYRDLSVIAAILLGGMVALSVFSSSYFYATSMGVHLARLRFGQPTDYFGQAFVIWLLTVLANIGLGKALVFGFSKEFNRGLGGDLLFQDGSYSEDGFLFAFLIAIPVTIHFLTILFSVNAQAAAIRRSNDEPE